MKVEIKGPNRRLLKPEMTANVEIAVVEKNDILLVPVAALARRRRERLAAVRKPDGTAEQRSVKTGASDGEFVEVVGGLSEGDEITMPREGAQSRWRAAGGRDANKARQERMKMRVMSGGRR